MKYCKDCIYCQLLTGEIDKEDYSKCFHPDVVAQPKVSLVTGQAELLKLPYAATVRNHECGEEGKLYVEKTYPRSVLPSQHLTEQNCYERGFRFNDLTRKYE